MNGLLFKKRNCAKFDYDIKVHHLMKIPKSGIIMYITWSRGKKHTGETKKTFVKDKIAIWEESIKFKGTLFKNSKGKFKKKYISIAFHEVVKDRKTKGMVGEIKLNLADFSSQQQENFSSTKTIPVNLWSSNEAQFKFTISSNLRKGGGNGLDTLLSENTTMTDASDDEDDDDDPFSEDLSSHKSSSGSSKSSPILTSAAHKSYLERRKNLHQKLNNDSRFKNWGNEGDEDGGGGGLSDDDTSSPRSNSGSSLAPNGGIDKRRIAQLRRRGAQQRRRDNTSFSLDDDSDPFTTAISNVEEKTQLSNSSNDTNSKNNRNSSKRSSRRVEESLDDTSSNGEDKEEVRDAAVQKAKEKLSLQEQKMRQMQEEIVRLQKETNERSVIDSVINNRQPEFCENLPLAAPILFKVLRHWDCFSSAKSDFPNKIYSSIRTVVENNADNNDLLCYWLSSCCIVLNLLQKEYPVSLENDTNGDDRESMRVNIPDDPNVSSQTNSVNTPRKQLQSVGDDAEFAFESPIAKFKGEMIQLSIKIYSQLVENIYKALINVLVPAMFQTKPANGNRSLEPRAVTCILKEYHNLLVKNLVFKELIAQFFVQIYYFINCHTFNSLFDTQNKRCKMGSAIMLKMGVSELEMWSDSNQMHKCRDQLGTLRQASDIMIMNKASLVDEATRKEVCPTLSLIQVRKILQLYHPDEYDPDTVPSAVLKALPASDPSKNKGDKPELDTSVVVKPKFDLDNEIYNWKKVKTSKLTGEVFAFLN